jgi:hypothetical protein
VTSLDNLQTAGTEREGGKGQESKPEDCYRVTSLDNLQTARTERGGGKGQESKPEDCYRVEKVKKVNLRTVTG